MRAIETLRISKWIGFVAQQQEGGGAPNRDARKGQRTRDINFRFIKGTQLARRGERATTHCLVVVSTYVSIYRSIVWEIEREPRQSHSSCQ